MSLKPPQGFSFFRSVGWFDDKSVEPAAKKELSPTLKLQTDKEIYRPGDSVTVTLEICSPASSKEDPGTAVSTEDISSLLVDNLSFEVKGIEKLDSLWFSTQKPLPGSKQRRGEHLFLDCTAPSIVSKVIVTSGSTKTYIVRVDLPKILPPSYRGINIRYFYYVRSTLYGRWLLLDNGHHSKGLEKNLLKLEARAPLQIWVSQKSNKLLNEEGNLLLSAGQLSIYWKEKDDDSEWTRANENIDGLEEGYDNSKDEVSSVSSYNPAKENFDSSLKNSLSMQSLASRMSNSGLQYSQGERSNFPSYMPLPQLSVLEVIDNSGGALVSPQEKLNHSSFSNEQRNSSDYHFSKDVVGLPFTPRYVEPAASEDFIRGRSYNIRINDQVLLRFSPKNSDSTYYFGDVIGGTLTFFHGEGDRRCLEVSITLETSETINQRVLHPSRKGSPTITKVHSEHHEVIADLLQTSFLFSIPIDGPMSFSTSKISVQWSLRFEFFTTPEGLDLTRYEHPLLVEKREKGEWVLPITVYAPPLRRQAAQTRHDKPLPLGNLFPS